MKTIHDENKIGEIKTIYYDVYDSKGGRIVYDFGIENAMKKYAEYIHEKTIDECIACVPLTGTNHCECSYCECHDDCREQTITNLNNLKNNG